MVREPQYMTTAVAPALGKQEFTRRSIGSYTIAVYLMQSNVPPKSTTQIPSIIIMRNMVSKHRDLQRTVVTNH